MEKYQKQIKELFKEMVTDELYDEWADSFEIVSIDENKVIVTYHGYQKFKKFKKECKGILVSCIYSILGDKKKIKISKSKGYKAVNSKIKRNVRAAKFFVIGMVFVCIATAIIVVMCNYIGNRNFRETFYTVSSIKVDSQLRIIQLSDLHNCSYGENNEELLKRIGELEPDIIICTGDIVDSAKDNIDYAVNLGQQLSGIAPS